MQSKQSTLKIIKILEAKYGIVEPFLIHKNEFEFLIAVILSAQTTDLMVNKVTPDLFDKFPSIKDLANAEIEEIETLIRRVNFHKTKAKNIKATAQMILGEFQGQVPRTMENLLKLKGVGRKVANVIMSDTYKNPTGIVVDTHVKRVSYRIGWTKQKTPEKVELDLIKKWPKEAYFETPKHLILIGRNYCFANKRPDCPNCPLRVICEKNGVKLTV
jgi:endonuclease III